MSNIAEGLNRVSALVDSDDLDCLVIVAASLAGKHEIVCQGASIPLLGLIEIAKLRVTQHLLNLAYEKDDPHGEDETEDDQAEQEEQQPLVREAGSEAGEEDGPDEG